MLLIVSKELGKAHLRVTMSQATTLGDMVGLVRLGLWGLSAEWCWGMEGLTSAT